MDSTDVTVVTPIGPGHENLVASAVESALAEGVAEVIVVADGCGEIPLPENARVRVLRKRGRAAAAPTGPALARNRGVEQVRTPFFVPLDADDRLAPGMVLACLGVIDSGNYAYVYTDTATPQGERGRLRPLKRADLANGISPACSSLFRKEAWQRVGGYPTTPGPLHEDWGFYLLLAGLGLRGCHLPIVGMIYDRTTSTRSHINDGQRGLVRVNARRLVLEQTGWDIDAPLAPLHPVSGAPLITFVVPYYDDGERYQHRRYIGECIASIEAQDMDQVGVIVVDDGSCPEGAEALVGITLRGELVHVIHHDQNRGLPHARNTGALHTLSPFIYFLDADDRVRSDAARLMLNGITGATDLSPSYSHIDFFGNKEERYRQQPWDGARLAHGNFMTSSAMVRREAWLAVRERNGHGYDPDMYLGMEDYEFYCSLYDAGYRGVLVPEFIFQYRVHGLSMSSTTQRHRDEIMQVIRAKHPDIFSSGRSARQAMATARRVAMAPPPGGKGQRVPAVLVHIEGRPSQEAAASLMDQHMNLWATEHCYSDLAERDARFGGFDGLTLYEASMRGDQPIHAAAFQVAMMYLSTHAEAAAVVIGGATVQANNRSGVTVEL